MKVVVLGGGVFIGSHLCDLLSSKGYDVKIFDGHIKEVYVNFLSI